jgi:hypothetical protein
MKGWLSKDKTMKKSNRRAYIRRNEKLKQKRYKVKNFSIKRSRDQDTILI